MPGLPGAACRSVTSGSADSARASACSRPPEPRRRTRTGASLPAATPGPAAEPGGPLRETASMTDVDVDIPRSADAADFLAAVRESRSLHQPWLNPPDTQGRFDAYLDRAARDDQAAYLIRHHLCGALVGYVNVNNIVR